ncbi:transcription factor grauzone-like [Episyrphus balteatus]|uniref:transcription factor grauzone-like n=1 Tax=Episyrphus balteatus TaxID=286459 RepID=UPI0024851569|nr:transcription factor grauzone-like [Episyrphus balteatus]
MLCILCVCGREQTIDIFSEEGLTLNVCSIITKHFWIQPNKDDKNSRLICTSCWDALDAFHKFFEQVEAAHLALIVVEDVKEELKEDFETSLPSNTENVLNIDLKSNIDNSTHVKQDSTNLQKTEDSDSELPLSVLKKTCKTNPNTTSSNDDQESSAEWQDPQSDGDNNNDEDGDFQNDDDDDDDEDDDDEEDEKEKPKAKKIKTETIPKEEQLTKSGKKRGRPLKGTPRKTTSPKQVSEEVVKRKQLSQEYDKIIQEHMKLSCSICLTILPNFSCLRKHYRTQHNKRGYASCCDKKFHSKSILVDHIHTHLDPERFKCEKCSKVLADRRCLEVHMDMHIEDNQRTYQCDQCNKSFTKEILLQRHMHIHIPEEERKFPCEECNKLFSSSYTLKAHINNVHQNTYGKICDQCGKCIRGREAFQRHLLEHAGIPTPGEQCDKCGAKLKNKYCLKRHISAKHADLNVPHVCIICGKTAPNEPALQRHYYYVHRCQRNHKCPMCEKAFKKASGLREHMTTHTGEILYTCPYCPKTFNSNANMHSHRKKMHRKEWEETRLAAAQNN